MVLSLIVALDLMGQTLKAQAMTLEQLPPTAIIEPLKPAEKPAEKVEKKIEIKPKTVVQLVEEAWPNDPVMIRVARCESSFKKNAVGPLAEKGLYQIHPQHFKTAKALGMNLDTVEGNIAFAKYLHSKNGTRDWNSSRFCWK